jgi:HSP20 family protein
MAMFRWDPLADLLTLHERLDRLATGAAPGWTPPIDLYETSDHYVISLEVPGLSRSDIDISFHDGHLTLSGSRPAPSIPCEQYHRVERGHGSFLRTLTLPHAIDVDAIAADLRDGVLTVTIPKLANRGPRRISVD